VGRNAATFFLQGSAALKLPDSDTHSAELPWVGQAQPPRIGKPMPVAMTKAVADFLGRNEPALRYFQEGAKCEQSRYPTDLTTGPTGECRYLTKLSWASRFLAIYALTHANAGEGDKAGDALLVHLALVRSLEPEPLLVSQEVRASLMNVALQSLEQVLNRATLRSEMLGRLQTTLNQLESRAAAGTGFARGLIGERVMTRCLFDLPLQGQLDELRSTGILMPHEEIAAPSEKYSRAGDKQFVNDTYEQLLAAWKEAYPRRFKAVRDICSSRELMAANKQFTVSVVELRRVAAAVANEARCLAHLRVAQIAVSLERFKEAHSAKYPYNLGQLVPHYLDAVPKDPFDGQPLRYRQESRGYTLWSIAPKDKPGAVKRSPTEYGTFRVLAPSPQS